MQTNLKEIYGVLPVKLIYCCFPSQLINVQWTVLLVFLSVCLFLDTLTFTTSSSSVLLSLASSLSPSLLFAPKDTFASFWLWFDENKSVSNAEKRLVSDPTGRLLAWRLGFRLSRWYGSIPAASPESCIASNGSQTVQCREFPMHRRRSVWSGSIVVSLWSCPLSVTLRAPWGSTPVNVLPYFSILVLRCGSPSPSFNNLMKSTPSRHFALSLSSLPSTTSNWRWDWPCCITPKSRLWVTP